MISGGARRKEADRVRKADMISRFGFYSTLRWCRGPRNCFGIYKTKQQRAARLLQLPNYNHLALQESAEVSPAVCCRMRVRPNGSAQAIPTHCWYLCKHNEEVETKFAVVCRSPRDHGRPPIPQHISDFRVRITIFGNSASRDAGFISTSSMIFLI